MLNGGEIMVDKTILRAIMQDPKASDRYIAQTIGLTQPTITRHRHRLTKNKTISYEAIPDLSQLGYEIFAVTVFRRSAPENDNVVYAANTVEGILVFSVHKSYSDYVEFIRDYDVHSRFLIDLVDREPLKPLSFRNIPL